MRVYVDTGALIALLAADDAHHREAQRYFRSALERGTRFSLGRPVLVEYIDGLSKRVSKRKAMEEWRRLERSDVIRLEPETEEDWVRARELFHKYDDQPIDLTDSLSFAIMDRLGLREAFGFDPDFQLHGFTRVP